MPLKDFLKKIVNKVKGIFGGKGKMEELFEKLRSNPKDEATAKAIKEEFANNPLSVVREVLRRVNIEDKTKAAEPNLFVRFRQTWQNTIKKELVQPLEVITPSTKDELVQIVKTAEADGLLVRAVGKGHSFSDVANATDLLVSMLGLQSSLPVETDTLKPTTKKFYNAQSGMLVQKVNAELDGMGLALHTMAAFDQETIYGAIATSTHGTGLNVPGMPDMVRSVDLVAAGGKLYRVEPANGITDPVKFQAKYPAGQITLIQDDDKFHSIVVGFGLMGLVYSIVIEPVPAFFLLQRLWVTDWDTVKPRLADRSFFTAIDSQWNQIPKNPDGSTPPTRAQVFVNPYVTKNFITKKETHTCVVQVQTNVTQQQYEQLKQQEAEGPKSKIIDFVEDLLSNGAKGLHEDTIEGEDKNSLVSDIGIDALLALLNQFPLLTPLFLDISMIVLLSGSGKFGKSFVVMNQGKLAVKNAGYSVEPGLAVDASNNFITGAEKIMDVAALSEKYFAYLTGPFCMRFVKASEDYLSPEYHTDTCMIDVTMMLGTIGDDQMFDRLQLELLAIGARPHWGKICNLVNGEDLLKKMYPKYSQFISTMNFFNPNGTFNSRFSQRTGISPMVFNKP